MVASEYERACAVFERIRAAFPALHMTLDRSPEHVDLALDIPTQPGLLFDVSLNLQNIDELCLSAGALFCSMFPCTNPDVVSQYFETVSGLLSGRYRILEHFRGRRVALAELQRPSGGDWETIATCGAMLIPWLRKGIRIVQNTPAA